VQSLVGDDLPEAVADLDFQLLHVLVADSHAVDAVPVVQGGLVSEY
jgi:hypothetical protein